MSTRLLGKRRPRGARAGGSNGFLIGLLVGGVLGGVALSARKRAAPEQSATAGPEVFGETSPAVDEQSSDAPARLGAVEDDADLDVFDTQGVESPAPAEAPQA